jgi:cytochrome c
MVDEEGGRMRTTLTVQMGRLRRTGFAALIGCFAILDASGATAQVAPSPDFVPSAEKGIALARRVCTGCHLVEDAQTGAVPIGVPPFRSIANRRGQSAERIIDALIRPHVPMPDLQLTNEEILNIVTYLDQLRSDPSIKPFIAPGASGTPKPVFPKAS